MIRGWSGWLIKTIASIALISTITVFTTWKMVQIYADRILREIDIPVEQVSVQFQDLLAQLGNKPNKVNKEQSLTDSAELEREQGAGDAEEDSNAAIRTSEDLDSEPAVPVFGGNVSGGMDMEEQIIISAEEFNQKKDAISSEDKMRIFTLLFTKVPQDDIQHLSLLLEDGLTEEEMAGVQEVLKAYLEPAEIEELNQIIEKYAH